jgi:FixJ family two-component response regulator
MWNSKNMQSLNGSTSKDTRHIILIDDDDSVRQGLELMLVSSGYTVHAFSRATNFFENALNVAPCVLICDMNMPQMNGVELQTRLVEKGYGIPMIFISGEASVEQSIIAMKQGAVEFLTKPFNMQVLLNAIEHGFELAAKALENALKIDALTAQLQKLSPREREVFYLLAKGYNNTEILTTLDISLPTTKQYKSEVMRKLNLNSLSELIALNPL